MFVSIWAKPKRGNMNLQGTHFFSHHLDFAFTGKCTLWYAALNSRYIIFFHDKHKNKQGDYDRDETSYGVDIKILRSKLHWRRPRVAILWAGDVKETFNEGNWSTLTFNIWWAGWQQYATQAGRNQIPLLHMTAKKFWVWRLALEANFFQVLCACLLHVPGGLTYGALSFWTTNERSTLIFHDTEEPVIGLLTTWLIGRCCRLCLWLAQWPGSCHDIILLSQSGLLLYSLWFSFFNQFDLSKMGAEHYWFC